RDVLEQGPEDLDGDVARNEIVEDRGGIRLVVVDRRCARRLVSNRRSGGGHELERSRNLRDDRLELGIEQRAHVELALSEQLDDLPADLVGVGKADTLDFAQIDTVDDPRGEFAPQDIEALLADADDLDRLAL